MLRAEQVMKAAGFVEDAENILFSLLDDCEVTDAGVEASEIGRICARLGEIYNDLEDLATE